jgi:hypothetical protein
MNANWLTLPKERRVEILNQATEITGLPATAIEKDWWVTVCLRATLFNPCRGRGWVKNLYQAPARFQPTPT